MNFNIGDYVVYFSGEICLIDSIVKRRFDGVNEIEYYKLIPINSKKSSYYIPCNNCDTKIRSLLTKDEIFKLIDEMPDAATKWCEDKNARKSLFKSVLKGDDYHKLLDMMHTLYVHRETQREKGKKLQAADEKAMAEAEHILYQEFAFVLQIPETQVEDFIKERLQH